MIRLDTLEDIVRMWIAVVSNEPHRVRYWVEGTNWDSEIYDVKRDMREAIEAEEFGRLPDLQAQLEDYRSREVVKGSWDYEDTGLTVGQYFQSLDRDGQREFLRTHDIRAEKMSKDVDDFRLVIDGDECNADRLRRALAEMQPANLAASSACPPGSCATSSSSTRASAGASSTSSTAG